MATIKQLVDQAYADLNSTCGGIHNDYFGLVYLEREVGVPREKALNQIAFGSHDYGIDGFHFDHDRHNLYLFQFKYSDSYEQFKPSLRRLTEDGMKAVFAAETQDYLANPVLAQLKSCLAENRAIVDQLLVLFVFTGDPRAAEASRSLDQLREDLESKKHLVDDYCGRNVTMVIEFRSSAGKVGAGSHQKKTHAYPVDIGQTVARSGPGGEQMHVGFIKLSDLHTMYKEMGQRFFDRNIRSALPESEYVNRSLIRALRRILVEQTDDAAVFQFNHNGVTLAAEKLEVVDGMFRLTEPRVLNGAQTVTSFAKFYEEHFGNGAGQREPLRDLRVLCKVIANAAEGFVTTVTVNNNRQNPVEPWNLRANDYIQLELQDKFRTDLGMYYERQENAFANLSDLELEEEGITESKAIQLLPLARTFIVTDGDIARLSQIRTAFEDDKHYGQVFGEARLRADSRKILLCYKVQFRLRRLLNEIVEKGPNKYAYLHKARNLLWALLCQGALNDPDASGKAEQYGTHLTVEVNYTDWLAGIATKRCRPLISDLVAQGEYAKKMSEGNLSFLRANAAFQRCMESAHERWGWVHRKLR